MEDTTNQLAHFSDAGAAPENYADSAQHVAPRKRKKKKNRRARLLQRRLLVAGSALAVFLVIFNMGSAWRAGRGPAISQETVSAQLKALSALSSTTYHFSNLERFEGIEDFYGWDASDYSSFTVSYEGTIGASVDPAQAKVDIKGKSITVTLPEAKITAEEIKQDSVSIYNSKDGQFQTIEMTDFDGFKKNQKSVVDAKATASGLLFDASDKAKTAAKTLIEGLTGGSDKYDIAVR